MIRRPPRSPLFPYTTLSRSERPPRQGAYVHPGPADDHRLAAAAADLPEPVRGVAREAACTVALPRLDDIETQVRHAGQQRAGRLRGADVQSPVHLTGIGGNDGDGFALGPCGRDRSLADRGGADDYRHKWWERRAQNSAPPESAFQLLLGELDDRRSSVHVVRGARRREEPGHQLAHLVALEALAGLDGGPAGGRRREALQPGGPPPEPP